MGQQVNMENPELKPDNQSSPDRKRSRSLSGKIMLLGFVCLCLLFWAVNAVRHAREPKHLGKTAAEWFENASGWPDNVDGKRLMQWPAGIAIKNLGTNAIWFLWQEHLRKDPTVVKHAYRYWDMALRTPKVGYTREEVRQCKSFQYLCLLGPDCKILLPELLPRLTGEDLEAAQETAYFMGCIRKEPDLVVPALLQSMMMSNRTERTREFHLYSLQKYGLQAKSAAEFLRKRLADTSLSKIERMNLAWTILAINGPGPEAKFLAEQLRPGIYNSDLLDRLGANGPTALPAVPTLIQYAQNATNINHARGVMAIVRQIDPAGNHPLP